MRRIHFQDPATSRKRQRRLAQGTDDRSGVRRALRREGVTPPCGGKGTTERRRLSHGDFFTWHGQGRERIARRHAEWGKRATPLTGRSGLPPKRWVQDMRRPIFPASLDEARHASLR